MLTKRQRDALTFLEAFQRRYEGATPTIAQIADGLRISGLGRAHAILKSLEERGFIARGPRTYHAPRVIEILRNTARIPIFDADTLQLRGYLP